MQTVTYSYLFQHKQKETLLSMFLGKYAHCSMDNKISLIIIIFIDIPIRVFF